MSVFQSKLTIWVKIGKPKKIWHHEYLQEGDYIVNIHMYDVEILTVGFFQPGKSGQKKGHIEEQRYTMSVLCVKILYFLLMGR